MAISVAYLHLIAQRLIQKPSSSPELELVRADIGLPMAGQDMSNLLEALPFVGGGEFVDETWLMDAWEHLLNCFRDEIKEYPEGAAAYFAEYNSGISSCPDYAYLCKHVAAALYGVGAKLDQDPLLFFILRHVDVKELIRRSAESRMESMLKNAGRKTSRVIPEEEMHGIFGI